MTSASHTWQTNAPQSLLASSTGGNHLTSLRPRAPCRKRPHDDTLQRAPRAPRPNNCVIQHNGAFEQALACPDRPDYRAAGWRWPSWQFLCRRQQELCCPLALAAPPASYHCQGERRAVRGGGGGAGRQLPLAALVPRRRHTAASGHTSLQVCVVQAPRQRCSLPELRGQPISSRLLPQASGHWAAWGVWRHIQSPRAGCTEGR